MHAHAAGSSHASRQPPEPPRSLHTFQPGSGAQVERHDAQAADALAALLGVMPETPLRDLVRSVSLADVFCALSSAMFDHSIAQVVSLAEQGDQDARIVVRLLQRLAR